MTAIFVPLFAVALGLVIFGAQWVGGDPGDGLVSLAIMTAFGAVFERRAVRLAWRDRRFVIHRRRDRAAHPRLSRFSLLSPDL
jgi:hypothetical protein